MSYRPSILGAAASLVRSVSVAALAIEVCAVVVTAGGADWAPAWRLGLGFRFWRELAEWGVTLAFACVFASARLAAGRRSVPREALRDTRRCLWLNAAALALALFVPALAAL